MQRIQQELFLLLLFFHILSVHANNIVTGYIKDAQTEQPLAAANIEILGTFQGTISNEDGRYTLELKKLPATILVSYIGYESQSFTFTTELPDKLNILLEPIILETEPIIVIAEDPAMRIMREVIRQKKLWQDKLQTYKALAYSRLVFENDSGIVSIAESTSEAFWDRDKGPREVIKSKRQTSNLSDDQNFAFSSYIPNFYDDDIEIVGYQVVGPTNSDAFDFYEFKLRDVKRMDDHIVYLIDVIPTSKLQPTFIGQVSVLDSVFALLSIDLKPYKSIIFPIPIQALNLSYKQQFRNFGKEFWLPIDYRVEGVIKIGFTGLQFPNIIYKRITGLTDYEVNIDLPDSLYEDEEFLSVDSLAIKKDSLSAHTRPLIPLSHTEENAYETLDSTATLEKAFKPSGFLAKFIEVRSGSETKDTSSGISKFLSDFSPQLWFNRVDAWHVGVKYEHNLTKNFTFQFNTAYKTGLNRWSYGSSIEYQLKENRAAWVKFEYQVGTESRYNSPTYSMTLSSFAPLVAQDDYFDYYWNKAFALQWGYSIQSLHTALKIRYNDQQHNSLEKTSDFNLVWSDYKQRPNPEIEEGKLRSLQITLSYGEDYIPFGVIGQNRVELEIEYSYPDLIPSDFSFTRYQFSVDLRLNTFLRRRLLPNALDVRLTAGLSQGELPVQRFMSLDGNLIGFSPFGVLRSLTHLPYEGDKYFALFWEHNFRTVPFELLGLDYLTGKGISIILHGAFGRTWISEEKREQLPYDIKFSDKFHSEIGLSINGLFGLLRIDAIQRLDTNIFYLGFGLTRYF